MTPVPGPPANGGVVIVSETQRGPDLGRIAQGASANSVWRIDADSGEVSLVGGDAVRLTTGPAFPPVITIDCASPLCRNATITAVFAPVGGGRATILGFTPGAVANQGLALQSVSGAGTPRLLMTFLAADRYPARASFPLGVTVRVGPGGDAPTAPYGYSLVVTKIH